MHEFRITDLVRRTWCLEAGCRGECPPRVSVFCPRPAGGSGSSPVPRPRLPSRNSRRRDRHSGLLPSASRPPGRYSPWWHTLLRCSDTIKQEDLNYSLRILYRQSRTDTELVKLQPRPATRSPSQGLSREVRLMARLITSAINQTVRSSIQTLQVELNRYCKTYNPACPEILHLMLCVQTCSSTQFLAIASLATSIGPTWRDYY